MLNMRCVASTLRRDVARRDVACRYVCKHVYTDASVMKHRSGVGVYYEEKGVETSLGIKGKIDVNRAELAAMFVALACLDNRDDVMLYTDSVTSLKLLDGTLKNKKYTVLVDCIQYMVNKWDGEVSFELVKGHSGNRGNDKAERLARYGAGNENHPCIDLPDDLCEDNLEISHLVVKNRFNLTRSIKQSAANHENSL